MCRTRTSAIQSSLGASTLERIYRTGVPLSYAGATKIEAAHSLGIASVRPSFLPNVWDAGAVHVGVRKPGSNTSNNLLLLLAAQVSA